MGGTFGNTIFRVAWRYSSNNGMDHLDVFKPKNRAKSCVTVSNRERGHSSPGSKSCGSLPFVFSESSTQPPSVNSVTSDKTTIALTLFRRRRGEIVHFCQSLLNCFVEPWEIGWMCFMIIIQQVSRGERPVFGVGGWILFLDWFYTSILFHFEKWPHTLTIRIRPFLGGWEVYNKY